MLTFLEHVKLVRAKAQKRNNVLKALSGSSWGKYKDTMIDPNFDKTEFLHQCQVDIIPNVLEAMIRGDLEILKDWCHDGPFNVLSTPIKQAHMLGYQFCSKILDIDNLDLTMGKVMEQGPVLIISFLSQQILCMKDKAGKVVDGDPDKILRVQHLWVLCRDMNELNPRAAWRLLDLSAQSSEQLL